LSIYSDDNRLKSYCDYLTDTYISDESIFHPTIWASGSFDLTRTTNACKFYHSYFNQFFYKQLFIGHWLSIINEIQKESYAKICKNMKCGYSKILKRKV